MSKEVTFTRFIHPDTGIVSTIIKDNSLWQPLSDFLFENDLCLAIGEGQVAELNSDDRLHAPFVELVTTVPSAFVKRHDVILAEEVEAYPYRRTKSLLSSPITSLTDKAELIRFLSSPQITKARADQRATSQTWAKLITDLKSNFPPDKNGKYTRSQAPLFAKILTIQQLTGVHDEFLRRFLGKAETIDFDVFLSAQIMSFFIFYKYYLAGHEPRPPNDFGDAFHLHSLPYCKLALMERSMCEVLNQVKKNTDLLNGVVVTNIDFLKDWKWQEED
ncbi:MAG TPA: hypothetical protein VNO50_04995 [Pyrinomonadaceae bacterium]|nr:hypothetical protein [Pyrinomonadaceae bacterium]